MSTLQSLRRFAAPLFGAGAVGAAYALNSQAFSTTSFARAPSAALDPKNWVSMPLIHREQLTHNTYLFRFGFADKNQVAGMTVASCLITKATNEADGKPIIRPYTPVSEPETKGYMDLVVKCYPDGAMSKVFAGLKVGDSIDIKGPIPKIQVTPGKIGDRDVRTVGMLCGGTGITPMLQVAEHMLRDPKDTRTISLVYCNVSEDDIILKDRVDALAQKYKERFRVHYMVDKTKLPGFLSSWDGGVGYVTASTVKDHMPVPGPHSLVMVCGPPPMMKSISGDKAPDKSQGELQGLLRDLGYDSTMVFKF